MTQQQIDSTMTQAWHTAVQQEVKTRRWLAALLLQKRQQLFSRFAYYYQQLLAAPRKVRRQLGAGLATAALMLALSGAPTPAYAAEITVTPGAAGVVNGDGCSLVEAIINANNGAAIHDDCAPGSAGADTIVLAGDTYSYDTAFGVPHGGTQSALPFITTEITIEANGATIERTDGNMRILDVGDAGNLTLNSAIITGGEVNQRGGGILNSATLTINNSTISNNEGTFGGGIYNFGGGTLTVNNSTISGNSAATGGGFESAGGTVIINNSTITGNTAPSGGGGAYMWNNATATLNRTIVSGNINPDSVGVEIRLAAGTVNADNRNVLGHSDLSNAQAFSGFTPGGTSVRATSDGSDPTLLGSILNTTLTNNGGPTLTHELVTGSPAIDIAPAADCSGTPINGLDQRGVSRSQDGNMDGTAACDAGAVEFVPTVCGITANNDYTFGDVVINPSNLGSDLACLQVELVNGNHPHATASMSSDALETGRFWHINGFQNDGATPATNDFVFNLTLPYAGADVNSRACKWLGDVPPAIGFGWDCGTEANHSFVADESVTRNNYTNGFSDWAVGDNVGPTAVSLQSVTITSQQGGLAALAATLLTALSGIWLWARRPASDS